jgi:uncharacterized phage protein (TIGR02218 family)
MRTIPAALLTEIQKGKVCRCVKVTQADGTIWGVTNHDKPLTIDGQVYEPLPGELTGHVRSRVGGSVDNQSFGGSWVPGHSEQDLIDGDYDDATVEALIAGWALKPVVAVTVFKGRLGQLSWHRDGFSAEVLDNMKRLERNLGRTFGPGCPQILGDSICSVNLASFQVSGTVESVQSSRLQFTDSTLTQAAGHFVDGEVTWTSGANAGRISVVDGHASGGIITLQLPTYRDIQAGDTFTITPGCDKTFGAGGCAKFANQINFQGWPFLRGETKIT